MDLYEELVNGPGYAVCSIENMQLFKETRDSLIDKVNVSAYPEKNIDAVRKAMAKMSKAEINKAMVGLLTFTNLSKMIINSCPNLVETLCGKELFIQRRANTIFNAPGKEQARQWPHYEVMSGVSPFTGVVFFSFCSFFSIVFSSCEGSFFCSIFSDCVICMIYGHLKKNC